MNRAWRIAAGRWLGDNPGRARLLVVSTAAATAGLAIGGAGLVAPVLAVLAAVSLQFAGWKRLKVLLIGSTFVTVVRIDVLGASFRLEHLVLLATVVAMVVAGRERALVAAARDRTVMLFGAFVLWSGLVSALQAVDARESLLIVGWLALDWVFLVVILAAWDDPRAVARTGAHWAGPAAALAIGLWVAAQTVGTSLGVVDVDLERGIAAAGASFEPNLLGFTLAAWAFLVLTGAAGLSRRLRPVILGLALAGLALTLTRAAMVGFGAGVLVWALLGGGPARRRVLRVVGATACIALVVTAMAPGVATPITRRASRILDFGSGTGRLRVDSWRTAVGDLNGADWVVGLGSNSFGQRHLDPTLPGVPAYLGNLPLQTLYDGGMVGVVLLALTVASVVTRRRLRDGLGPGLLVLYVVCASATSPFWYGTTWILAGIACLDRRGKSLPPPTSDEPTSPVGASIKT